MSWLPERTTASERAEKADRAWHDANRGALPERANRIMDALWRTLALQNRAIARLSSDLAEARGGTNPDARHERPEEVVVVKVGRHKLRENKR